MLHFTLIFLFRADFSHVKKNCTLLAGPPPDWRPGAADRPDPPLAPPLVSDTAKIANMVMTCAGEG